jgi:predicted nucleic acid-binding protein
MQMKNKYCDCAITGRADYIVTEDRDFDVSKSIPFPSVTTINIEEFMKVLSGI